MNTLSENKFGNEFMIFYPAIEIIYIPDEIFGKDNFYLEIQKHIDVKDQDSLNEKLINLSQKLGIPLVATNDNHYVRNTDAKAQEILLCIQTQTTIDTKNRYLV